MWFDIFLILHQRSPSLPFNSRCVCFICVHPFSLTPSCPRGYIFPHHLHLITFNIVIFSLVVTRYHSSSTLCFGCCEKFVRHLSVVDLSVSVRHLRTTETTRRKATKNNEGNGDTVTWNPFRLFSPITASVSVLIQA